MNQRSGVQHFDYRTKANPRGCRASKRARRKQQQQRPNTLAAPREQVGRYVVHHTETGDSDWRKNSRSTAWRSSRSRSNTSEAVAMEKALTLS